MDKETKIEGLYKTIGFDKKITRRARHSTSLGT